MRYKSRDAKERRYGGSAGIFVRRRRKSLYVKTDLPSKNMPTITPSPVDDHPSAKNCTATVDLLFWDDVRCRPIYADKQNKDVAKVSSDDASISSEPEDTKQDKSGKTEATPRRNWSQEPQRIRSKSYSKNRYNPSSAENTVDSNTAKRLKNEHVRSQRVQLISEKCAVSSLQSPSSKVFAFASPPPITKSICGSLNNTSVKKPRVSRRKLTATFNDDAAERGAVTKRARPRRLQSETDSNLPANEGGERNSADKFDFVETIATQLGSSSSLASAKAFFTHLDSSETLNVVPSKQSDEKMSGVCVRTKRRVRVCDQELLEEYKQYSLATKPSGVDPIPIEEYARNRSEFFRTHDLFDGFLD